MASNINSEFIYIKALHCVKYEQENVEHNKDISYFTILIKLKEFETSRCGRQQEQRLSV